MSPLDTLDGYSILGVLSYASKKVTFWERILIAQGCEVDGSGMAWGQGVEEKVAFQVALPCQEIMCG